jgi:hypothetical protein
MVQGTSYRLQVAGCGLQVADKGHMTQEQLVKIFLDIHFEESSARASVRDQYLIGSAEAVRERYSQRYIPGQRLYLEMCQPMEQAHLVIDNNNVKEPILVRCAPCSSTAHFG